MIEYAESADGIGPSQLEGFFEGWPNPPSPETHLRLLDGSDSVVLAIDSKGGSVVGFVSALSDGVLAVYIAFLEVRPEYRRRGIGRELVRRMLERYRRIYMVDLMCDAALQPFYKALGMRPGSGMMVRNMKAQSGQASPP